MGNRKITFAIGEYYHLYSRGVDKRIIFLDHDDKKRFVKLMFFCNGSEPVIYKEIRNKKLADVQVGHKLLAIGAHCLMMNHFHLLVKETKEGGIVKFMVKLLTAYSKYFNKKYERTGSLFESEFKSKHLSTDEYLKYMFAYIHLNPVKILNPNWKKKLMDRTAVEIFLNDYTFQVTQITWGKNGRIV